MCKHSRYRRCATVGRGLGVDEGLGVTLGVGVGVAVAVGVDVGVGVGVGVDVGPCTSNEPMSIRPFPTRLKPGPRWSKKGGGVKPGAPALIAGLPANSVCVNVGPPLSCNGPSIGSMLIDRLGQLRLRPRRRLQGCTHRRSRRHRSGNGRPQTARLQDNAAELQKRAAAVIRIVDTAAVVGCVVADSAAADRDESAAAACGLTGDTAAAVLRPVSADSAVAYGYYAGPSLAIPINDAAAPVGRVAAQGAVDDRHPRVSVGDAAAGVAAYRAAGDR